MAQIIDTLHPESNVAIELYPNIVSENIPDKAVTKQQLADDVQNALIQVETNKANISANTASINTLNTEKASQSSLDSLNNQVNAINANYVTTDTEQTISGKKLFSGANYLEIKNTASADTLVLDGLNENYLTFRVNGVNKATIAIKNDKIGIIYPSEYFKEIAFTNGDNVFSGNNSFNGIINITNAMQGKKWLLRQNEAFFGIGDLGIDIIFMGNEPPKWSSSWDFSNPKRLATEDYVNDTYQLNFGDFPTTQGQSTYANVSESIKNEILKRESIKIKFSQSSSLLHFYKHTSSVVSSMYRDLANTYSLFVQVTSNELRITKL